MTPRFITGRDPITNRSLSIEILDGYIYSIKDGPEQTDAWLSPGLVDLQVNGYGGCDLNDDAVDADVVVALVSKVVATGTTTFLPTIITTSEKRIVRALRAIAEARRVSPLAAHVIPFVHLEGPHISPNDGARGAHSLEYVRPPDLAEFERWQQASDNLVGMVTLSPHWQNTTEYIAALAGKGILVALGHSDATPEQIHAAAIAGARLSTHLGNGIARTLTRHPNLLWAQLADDRLTATFIADGHHLPPDTLQAMMRAKGMERSILVSDSVALAGMPPGTYNSPIGNHVKLRADGRLSMAGTEFLAGAACSLSHAVAYLANSTICSTQDAFRMATSNPGRLVGGRGVLRPGAKADLLRCCLDADKKTMQIETLLVEGRTCL